MLSIGSSSRCDRECYTDADCRGNSKCCSSGCGYACVVPDAEHVAAVTQPPPEPPREPVRYPGSQAPALENVPQEEVDVTQPEGQMATLRCYATGYPLPTVTWRQGAVIVSIRVDPFFLLAIFVFTCLSQFNATTIQINTNQGRYVLTSTGDLQIVQVHRSDSGTYVCVAENGIGAPVQREVKLNVAGKFICIRWLFV